MSLTTTFDFDQTISEKKSLKYVFYTFMFIKCVNSKFCYMYV